MKRNSLHPNLKWLICYQVKCRGCEKKISYGNLCPDCFEIRK